MKLFKTKGVVSLFSGLIKLNGDQASKRQQQLNRVKDDIYEIVSQVQFKAGEVIGLESMPKVFEHVLDDLGKEKKEAKKSKES